jgi:hypothetical protein
LLFPKDLGDFKIIADALPSSTAEELYEFDYLRTSAVLSIEVIDER